MRTQPPPPPSKERCPVCSAKEVPPALASPPRTVLRRPLRLASIRFSSREAASVSAPVATIGIVGDGTGGGGAADFLLPNRPLIGFSSYPVYVPSPWFVVLVASCPHPCRLGDGRRGKLYGFRNPILPHCKPNVYRVAVLLGQSNEVRADDYMTPWLFCGPVDQGPELVSLAPRIHEFDGFLQEAHRRTRTRAEPGFSRETTRRFTPGPAPAVSPVSIPRSFASAKVRSASDP